MDYELATYNLSNIHTIRSNDVTKLLFSPEVIKKWFFQNIHHDRISEWPVYILDILSNFIVGYDTRVVVFLVNEVFLYQIAHVWHYLDYLNVFNVFNINRSKVQGGTCPVNYVKRLCLSQVSTNLPNHSSREQELFE